MHQPGKTEGPGPLSKLERTVLTAMLGGESETRVALRAQLGRATVLSRTHSGVGFVTRLAVPDSVPDATDPAAAKLRPVLAEHPALPERAEFLLQLKGGRLAVLEAYCYDGVWPPDESLFRVVA